MHSRVPHTVSAHTTILSHDRASLKFEVSGERRPARLVMESEKSAEPLFEWLPPPAYLKWRLALPASRALLVQIALGLLGGAFIYATLNSVMLALLFLLFATVMGLAAKWLIPRTNAGRFRALEEELETQAASKRQRIAYRDLSSCVVEHRRYKGVGFALLGLRVSAEYKRARKWYEPRALKPVPVGDGEELERVLDILKQKGVSVIYAGSAGE